MKSFVLPKQALSLVKSLIKNHFTWTESQIQQFVTKVGLHLNELYIIIKFKSI